MSYRFILAAENRQLLRNPYKLLALAVFALTCFYGLYKGHAFYNERVAEIERIQGQQQELVQQANYWLENNIAGPEGRPWVNIQEPFWAMWYANHHAYDAPTPMMIYSIGQADQFGFYKRVSMWTTGYDPDLIADLQNPEFVGIGSLDFTFIWIFLMPVLLIILLYDVKGLEYDLGFLKSIMLHAPSQSNWLLQRVSYYFLLALGLLLAAVLVPFFLTSMSAATMGVFLAYGLVYMLVWFAVLFFIIKGGKGQTDQAVKMLVVWLLFAVIMPGGVHQYLNLKHPPNYMLDWVTTKRVEQDEIFALSYQETLARVKQAYDWLPPDAQLHEDSVSQDIKNSMSRMVLAMEFETVINGILADLEEKNRAIKRAHIISPVTFFQNRLNNLCGTDYYANRSFRESVQYMGLKINETILKDELNQSATNAAIFKQYQALE